MQLQKYFIYCVALLKFVSAAEFKEDSASSSSASISQYALPYESSKEVEYAVRDGTLDRQRLMSSEEVKNEGLWYLRPLFFAASGGKAAFVEILIDAGADFNNNDVLGIHLQIIFKIIFIV